MNRLRTISIGLLAVTATLGLAACGDDDSADTTTTTAEQTTTTAGESEATIRFDEQIQQELADVGCYKGEIDGILGAETDAAILEFQRYDGITADGELGPETEKALKDAVAAGRTVCDSNVTTTSSATTTTASGTAPCTAAALMGGLPDEGETITSYVCSEGYAAGSVSSGGTFLLQADGDRWVAPSQDPCDSASAGIPPVILEDGCDS